MQSNIQEKNKNPIIVIDSDTKDENNNNYDNKNKLSSKLNIRDYQILASIKLVLA
jgi:hypothetical protein